MEEIKEKESKGTEGVLQEEIKETEIVKDEKQKKKEKKKKDKVIRKSKFKSFLFVFIILIIVISSIGYYLIQNNIITKPINYKELCNLIVTGKIYLNVNQIQYNLENFSLEYFADDYTNKFDGFMTEETFYNGKINIVRKDFLWQYDEEDVARINSFYFIEQDKIIIIIQAEYQDLYTYNQYEEKITNLAMKSELLENKSFKNSNLFTNLISLYEIKDKSKFTEYETIADKDSSVDKAYDKLTDVQKEKYNELYKVIIEQKEDFVAESKYVDIGEFHEDEYFYVSRALELDLFALGFDNHYIYTEFFINETDGKEMTLLRLEENMENSLEEMEIIRKKAEEIISEMPEGLSNFGKYKYLANSICEITEYAYEELEIEQTTFEDNNRIHSMIGVFINGRAVCDGYARAYKYLCQKIGLFCDTISGFDEETNISHEYNYIKLGGEYYFVDVTWMDDTYDDSYFAFTYSEELENEHNAYYENWKATWTYILPLTTYLGDNLGTIDWYTAKNIY